MDDAQEDELVAVALYDDLDDAEQAATALVARGIGGVVQRRGTDFTDPDVPDSVTCRVAVLAADHVRAAEILGFAEPATPLATEAVKPELPLGRVLLIFLIAMIVIPGLAFLLSYNLSQ